MRRICGLFFIDENSSNYLFSVSFLTEINLGLKKKWIKKEAKKKKDLKLDCFLILAKKKMKIFRNESIGKIVTSQNTKNNPWDILWKLKKNKKILEIDNRLKIRIRLQSDTRIHIL